MEDPDTQVGTSIPEQEPAADAVRLALVEEEAIVGKRQVNGARIRVTTHTDLIEQHHTQSLRTDEVEVTRVAVNRTLGAGEAAPGIRIDGNVTVVPVIEERVIVIVEKRFVVREELHIRRDTRTEEVDVPVTLRKQRPIIERGPTADGPDVKEG